MIRNKQLFGLKLKQGSDKDVTCIPCIRGKITCSPILRQRVSPLTEKFGDHTHMDIWGPAKVRTLKHAEYSLTLVDDTTRWAVSHFMVHKSNAFIKFVNHHTYITTHFGVISKILQCDCDSAFLSDEFREYMKNNGIVYKLTVHDTPEHNRVAERMHLTLFNGVHVLLITSGLPAWLWGYALMHVTFIHNITFSRVIGMSPYQKRHGRLPPLTNLHPWGCKVIAKVSKPESKLDPCGDEAHWIGFDTESNSHFIIGHKFLKFQLSATLHSSRFYPLRGSAIKILISTSMVRTSTLVLLVIQTNHCAKRSNYRMALLHLLKSMKTMIQMIPLFMRNFNQWIQILSKANASVSHLNGLKLLRA